MAQLPNKFSLNSVLVGLLVIASFLIGSLYTKVTLLEKGLGGSGSAQGTTGAPAGKYKTFDDALKDYAKQVGINGDKLISCINSGDKKQAITDETKEGEGLGVSGTPAFFVNGKFIGGAFPFEAFKDVIDKELAGTSTTNAADYIDVLSKAGDAFNPQPKTVSLGNAPVEGETNAKITVVEYSDFQCPYCGRSFPTIKQVMDVYKGKVKLVYKQFPLVSIHPKAQRAAEASLCAKDQGKFWQFHDKLFENQTEWSNI